MIHHPQTLRVHSDPAIDWTALGHTGPPQVSWEVITPNMARALMERNVNRKLRDRHLLKVRTDIEEGRWRITGDTIKLDWDGNLIDGQHRLLGAIRSNKPIITLVVRGLDPQSQQAMDGVAPRSLANQLVEMRQAPQATKVASLISELHRWIEGTWRTPQYGDTPSVSRGLEIYDEFPHLEDYVRITSSRAKQLSARRVAVSAWAAFSRITDQIDPDVSEVFHSQIAEGLGLEETNATYRLRQLWINWGNRGTHEPPTAQVYRATLIKAWNAHWDGRPIRNVAYKVGANEVYPIPLGIEKVPWVTVPAWKD